MNLFAILAIALFASPSLPLPTNEEQGCSIPQTTKRSLAPDSLVQIAAFDGAKYTDEEYTELLNQGCTLVGMMSSEDSVAARSLRPENTRTTAASQFTDAKAFEDWGYTASIMDWSPIQFGMGPELSEPLEKLHVDPIDEDSGMWSLAEYEHDTKTTHDGREFPATKASFDTLFNVEQGVIVAWRKFGAEYMGSKQHPPVTTLPSLRSWHDIAFLDWQRVAKEKNKAVGNLRYIFSSDVANGYTKDAIKHVLGEALDFKTCGKYLWDNRKTFTKGEEGFNALLASPNGRGSAMILITHKSVFGQKRQIESVSVWCADKDGEINLMFTVAEA
ncbi:hypothetical protein P280DRAFT_484604 [Massarina eburnea CBS 473.64]|uniref:Uncharacterized protein n=1 Tax=Massarina eburnea CBS 473.64 TaxID=1395130 RepID=A0A6A6RJP9_9PLEO|nr:hypothetical protein P280DRAFT_484604 [Massarina eburnea CBS 473.64]